MVLHENVVQFPHEILMELLGPFFSLAEVVFLKYAIHCNIVISFFVIHKSCFALMYVHHFLQVERTQLQIGTHLRGGAC